MSTRFRFISTIPIPINDREGWRKETEELIGLEEVYKTETDKVDKRTKKSYIKSDEMARPGRISFKSDDVCALEPWKCFL
jgi:hypothetical protein